MVRQVEPLDVRTPSAAVAAPVATAEQPRQPKAANQKELNRVSERLNQAAEVFDVQARFSVHKATGEIMIKIVNTRTGRVLREIPPERMLDIAASMEKLLGLVVDERA